MRYHAHMMEVALDKIDSLATRRVFDKLLADMSVSRSNEARVEAAEREALAIRARCSQTVVRMALKKLVDAELLERVRRGVYRVNPRFIYTGALDDQTADIERYRKRRNDRRHAAAVAAAEASGFRTADED